MDEILIVGKIVHYVMPNGEHRPAVISRVWNESGLCNLQVFSDGSNDVPYTQSERDVMVQNFGMDLKQVEHGHFWKTSIRLSENPEPNTWHWIEKA